MEYTFNSRIRHSETDEDGILKLENFINYFQDCSTFQSEDLGLGIDYFREQNIAWVLNSWQIEILKYPKACDYITVGTFAYDFKSFLGYRNFFMKDDKGEFLCKAASIWVLIDLKTGKPQKPRVEDVEKYGKQDRLDMEYGSRKIAVPDGLKGLDEIEVKEHHLDTNHHVNNGQFIKMAALCLDNKQRPMRLRAEYKKQAYLSDIIVPFTDGKVVDLRSVSGESYCIVEVQ